MGGQSDVEFKPKDFEQVYMELAAKMDTEMGGDILRDFGDYFYSLGPGDYVLFTRVNRVVCVVDHTRIFDPRNDGDGYEVIYSVEDLLTGKKNHAGGHELGEPLNEMEVLAWVRKTNSPNTTTAGPRPTPSIEGESTK